MLADDEEVSVGGGAQPGRTSGGSRSGATRVQADTVRPLSFCLWSNYAELHV